MAEEWQDWRRPPPLRNGFWIAERKRHVQSFDPQVRKKTLSKFLGNNLTCCHLLIFKSYTFEIACGTLFTKQSGRLWRQTTDFGRFQSYKWWRSSAVTPGEKSLSPIQCASFSSRMFGSFAAMVTNFLVILVVCDMVRGNWGLSRPCAPKQAICLWWCELILTGAGHFPISKCTSQFKIAWDLVAMNYSCVV